MSQTLTTGQRGTTSGFPATVIRQYEGSMYEVRVPGGVCCIDASDFVPEATCTTCGRPVANPFREYDREGKIVHGCVAADHDGHLVRGTESSRWHNRPEAKRIRRRSAKMWGPEAVR